MSRDRIVHPDGKPLLYVISWPLLRYLDGKFAHAGPFGRTLVKNRNGRIRGCEATQESLWEAGEVKDAA